VCQGGREHASDRGGCGWLILLLGFSLIQLHGPFLGAVAEIALDCFATASTVLNHFLNTCNIPRSVAIHVEIGLLLLVQASLTSVSLREPTPDIYNQLPPGHAWVPSPMGESAPVSLSYFAPP
jgi:hypothetical protein